MKWIVWGKGVLNSRWKMFDFPPRPCPSHPCSFGEKARNTPKNLFSFLCRALQIRGKEGKKLTKSRGKKRKTKKRPPKKTRKFRRVRGGKVTRIAATSKSQIASDCNRNSKKTLRLQKHPLKPNLWTREPPVLCGFYSVSEAPHGSGNPPEYVATTRVWFWIAANFLAQCDFCDCDTAILLRFLQEKLATSKLWLPIASDLWLRLRGSLSRGGKVYLKPFVCLKRCLGRVPTLRSQGALMSEPRLSTSICGFLTRQREREWSS